ncbi:B-family DNA polymerase, catalytic domain [Enterococcus phage dArtagnan]|uniref:B-family DNA polymerase, catalytic domain n=1 Tax=Enterococcus phage dArtagnan TaxID=2795667 RepID=A0A8D6XVK8_9CAUD|nr:B-family DNA polymerase, catalytic domain [Enterococcus phage dArtagnan]
MKNIAEFKGAEKLASKLLEIFAALAGNGKSFDPLVEGIHQVVVINSEERLSAKGKKMREIKVRSINDGRDATFYIMKFRKQDWKTWEKIEVGQQLNITLKYNNGFPNVTINQKGSIIDVLPEKPNDALTNQSIYIYDIEVFKKDNLFVFRDYFTKEWKVIHNDLKALRKFYLANRDSLFVGYNSSSYDSNVMRAHMQGKNPYHISKAIIESEDRGLVYKMFDTKKTPLFGMDLYQDNRGFSLKEHSAFMGINIKETEVDFDLDRELTEEEQVLNELYCKNDVLATEKRFEQNIGMLVAKAAIALYFGLDKMALSMTNANLTAELLGAEKTPDRGDELDKYELPEGFEIESETIRQAFMTDEFEANDKGHASISLDVPRRDVTEVLGVGGIHGAKESFIHVGNFHARDVGSLYPNTMVLFDYLSRNIPEEKRHIYQMLLDERMEAKYSNKEFTEIKGVQIPTKLLINGYKLPLNTKYGAMGAEFNKLYDPRMRLLVCITGQMAMWDLLEKIENHATIIQSNTDAHYYIPFSEEDEKAIDEIANDWMKRTGYTLDDDPFKAIFQKDVNNYLAVTSDGKVKFKGAIGLTNGLKVSKAIVSNAFINYVVSGKDYREFIYECDELRQFQMITKTGYTFDDTVVRDSKGNELKAQKVNRTFAVKDPNKAVEIFKVKRGAIIEEEGTTIVGDDSYTKGLPNAPEYYAIDNAAIGEGWITLADIDKEYYINQVEDLLVMWFGTNWKERIEQAHSQIDEFPEVKNYID